MRRISPVAGAVSVALLLPIALSIGLTGAFRVSAGACALFGNAFAADLPASSRTLRSDDPAADAVRAAQSVPLPDAEDLIGGADLKETLPAFGGGNLSVEEQTRHYQGGYGSLFAPAAGRVVTCRNASDPECLAVQMLDHGFPERPQIGEDILIQKDEVLGNQIVETPGIGGTTDCRDFTITTPAVSVTETCRPGGWYERRTCVTGWETTALQSWSKWTCRTERAFPTTLACRIPVEAETRPETTERCFFGSDALKPVLTQREETRATATALFPALCRAPQTTESVSNCSDVLEVTVRPDVCTGPMTSTTTGDAPLFEDPCPGADTATVTTECSRVQQLTKRLKVEVNGFPAATIQREGSVTITSPGNPCRLRAAVTSHTCAETRCMAVLSVDVEYVSGSQADWQGTISVRHPYVGWSATPPNTQEDKWTSTCPQPSALRSPQTGARGGAR